MPLAIRHIDVEDDEVPPDRCATVAGLLALPSRRSGRSSGPAQVMAGARSASSRDVRNQYACIQHPFGLAARCESRHPWPSQIVYLKSFTVRLPLIVCRRNLTSPTDPSPIAWPSSSPRTKTPRFTAACAASTLVERPGMGEVLVRLRDSGRGLVALGLNPHGVPESA